MAIAGGEFTQKSPTPLKVPVEIRFEGSDQMTAGFQACVGSHGMFVTTANPPPVGSIFQFELRMDEIKSVRGFGEVVWIRVRAGGPGEPRGMGARFRLLVLDGEDVLEKRLRPLLDANP